MVSEILLAAAVLGGAAVLWAQRRGQGSRRRVLARRQGLRYAPRGLEHLPAELQSTVLFAVTDGGHERDVLSGELILGEVSIPFSSFDLAAQRDVRGEWAYVTTTPPFRIHSPLTVLAYRLPHQLAHLVIKRRGPAERLTDDVVHELAGGARSVAVGVRQASGIDHTIAVPPPAPLPAEPSADIDLGPDFFVWTADPEQARALLTAPVRDYLRSPASGRHELVVEALGPLVLCYCASSGALDEGELYALDTFARELVERLLSELTPQSPRGVGY